jgi:predicted RecA/RadA family phage recombinase
MLTVAPLPQSTEEYVTENCLVTGDEVGDTVGVTVGWTVAVGVTVAIGELLGVGVTAVPFGSFPQIKVSPS